MKQEKVKELLLESLEHEKCGVEVYQAALQCVLNDDLKEEFKKYLDQTRTHVQVLTEVCLACNIDPETQTPGRGIVRMMGQSLVQAMQKAGAAGKPEAAEIVACECVVLAETKDHLDWELIGQVAERFEGEQKEELQAAYEQVEDQEDEHLYHSRGWCRELWMQSMGMQAILPPPEERKQVKSAIEAARAQKGAGR